MYVIQYLIRLIVFGIIHDIKSQQNFIWMFLASVYTCPDILVKYIFIADNQMFYRHIIIIHMIDKTKSLETLSTFRFQALFYKNIQMIFILFFDQYLKYMNLWKMCAE
jgi:hypothetical protein